MQVRLSVSIYILAWPVVSFAQQPTLKLPYPPGAAICTQGASGQTSHQRPYTAFDLDLDTPNDSDQFVLAAADGVAYGIQSSPNFGNHVNIDHGPVDPTFPGGNHYFTLYAHLKVILVRDGQFVRQGQVIGIEDNTGFSRGDHIHFGLHTGNPQVDAIQSQSIVASSIWARDVTAGQGFQPIRGDQLQCGLEIGVGHTYESDNAILSVLSISTTACPPGSACSGSQGTTFSLDGGGFTPTGQVRRFIEDSGGTQTEIPALFADANGQIAWSSATSCTSAVGAFHLFAVDATASRVTNRVTQTVTPGNCPTLLPDLVVTKTGAPDPVVSASQLVYTIHVQNVGSATAADVEVSDVLPAGTNFQFCSVACSFVFLTRTVTFGLGPLAAGASMSFDIIVDAPLVAVPTAIVNTASVSTSSTESDTGNNQASQTTTVNPRAVSVSVSPSSVVASPGSTVQFVAIVTGTNNVGVAWSILEGAAGGLITQAGLYTAPSVPCTYHVVATSQADPSKSATGTVTVSQPPETFGCTGKMLVGRREHTATLLANGSVLTVGGEDGSAFHPTAELYDPVTGLFLPTGNMAIPRGRHTATLLMDGRVLIAGGDNQTGLRLSSAEIYDPASGSFLTTGGMSAGRSQHTATLLASGKVLIVGGTFDGNKTAELYDPSTGTFTLTGNLSTTRFWHTATSLPSGKVLIVGGVNGSIVADGSAEVYDPVIGGFTIVGSMATARALHTATLLPDGRVLIAGGQQLNAPPLSSVELFDPQTGTFFQAASMAQPRLLHAAVLMPIPSMGSVLVVGGSSAPFALGSAEIYDVATGTFRTTGSMMTSRSGLTAVLLRDGRVLVMGGSDLTFLDSAELYLGPGGLTEVLPR